MTTQSDFEGALLDANKPVPAGLSDGSGRPAGRRYWVYRNNVAVSLGDALGTGFPAISKLVGPQNFKNLAAIFLRQHPPKSPLMMHYGAEFPAFLEGFEPLKHLGYLGDVARIELALRQSYHAADATAADPTQLQRLGEAELMTCRMTLAPAVHILRSAWPAASIWAFNMVPGSPKPQAKPEDTLITRPEFDPMPHVLPHGAADFLIALAKGATFEDALKVAQSNAADFDLGATLNLALGHGAISDILS